MSASETIECVYEDGVFKPIENAKLEESTNLKIKVDLSEYFGALKDSPLLDKIEADSKRVREMARSRI